MFCSIEQFRLQRFDDLFLYNYFVFVILPCLTLTSVFVEYLPYSLFLGEGGGTPFKN